VQANFNRAAYDAQNQAFTSRFNLPGAGGDEAKKTGPIGSWGRLLKVLTWLIRYGFCGWRMTLRWLGPSPR